MKRLLLSLAALAVALSLPAQEMRTEKNSTVKYTAELEGDFVVVGGGLAGVCAAVSAARHGAKVILVQDRPVLGGNASSEIRMGICGAKTSQDYEAGILEEMQLRNFRYNPLQRYTLWDDAIYSTVVMEPNIKLLLNTSVQDVVMDGERIAAVKAWNINAYTEYTIKGSQTAPETAFSAFPAPSTAVVARTPRSSERPSFRPEETTIRWVIPFCFS